MPHRNCGNYPGFAPALATIFQHVPRPGEAQCALAGHRQERHPCGEGLEQGAMEFRREPDRRHRPPSSGGFRYDQLRGEDQHAVGGVAGENLRRARRASGG